MSCHAKLSFPVAASGECRVNSARLRSQGQQAGFDSAGRNSAAVAILGDPDRIDVKWLPETSRKPVIIKTRYSNGRDPEPSKEVTWRISAASYGWDCPLLHSNYPSLYCNSLIHLSPSGSAAALVAAAVAAAAAAAAVAAAASAAAAAVAAVSASGIAAAAVVVAAEPSRLPWPVECATMQHQNECRN